MRLRSGKIIIFERRRASWHFPIVAKLLFVFGFSTLILGYAGCGIGRLASELEELAVFGNIVSRGAESGGAALELNEVRALSNPVSHEFSAAFAGRSAAEFNGALGLEPAVRRGSSVTGRSVSTEAVARVVDDILEEVSHSTPSRGVSIGRSRVALPPTEHEILITIERQLPTQWGHSGAVNEYEFASDALKEYKATMSDF